MLKVAGVLMFPTKLIHACAILLFAAAGTARAQVGLPPVQVPESPRAAH